MVKYCSRCKSEKQRTDFYVCRSKPNKDGLQAWCKSCTSEYGRRRYNNPGWRVKKLHATERRRVVRQYGKTLEELDQLKAGAAGCEICGEAVQSLHIDHCHATGLYRGILCGSCNRALGLFKDNPDSLRRAAEYLEER